MTLMTLYIACVGVGAVLMGASILLGDADHDVDHDFDANVDLDMDLDADIDAGGDLDAGGDAHVAGFEWSVLPFGSLRFWTFLVESFGLTGALLSCAGIPSAWTIGISLAMGMLVGWSGFAFFQYLAREEITGQFSLSAYKNAEGRVLLRIPVEGRGKIVLEGPGGRVELMARSVDGVEIARGDQVLVVAVKEGVADVTSLTPKGKAAKSSAAVAAAATQKKSVREL